MHEFQIINKYFSKLSNKNKSSLNLEDDVFYDSQKQKYYFSGSECD